MRERGNLAVSAMGQTVEAQRREAGTAATIADLVELRLDRLLPEERRLGELLAGLPLPAIATCRRVADGGGWEGDEAGRLRLLEEAAACGARFVDLELDVLRERKPPAGAECIASLHDFAGIPEDLDAAFRELHERGDVAKLAVLPRSELEVVELLALQRGDRGRSLVIGMGTLGRVTRLAASALGAFLGFGHLGGASGPGQPAAALLRGAFRYGGEPPPPWRLIGLVNRGEEEVEEWNRALEREGRALLAVPLEAGFLEVPPGALKRAGFAAVVRGEGGFESRELKKARASGAMEALEEGGSFG